MTDEQADQLDAANRAVTQTRAAYVEATTRRANIVRDLRAAGVRPAEIGRRLGVSSSRVGQIAEIRETE